jgi:membrane-associated phospholipid phosphatase
VNGMKAPLDGHTAARPMGRIAAVSRIAAALVHNLRRNLPQWLRLRARVPNVRAPSPSKEAIVTVVVTLGVIIASMFLVDEAATDWARHLPRWFTDAFEQITNAGYSGWPLIPSALIVLCLAALTSPALPRLTQGVLVALAARFGYLFIAVGAPGLFVTIVKRLIGRARPYMDIHGDPFTYMPFAWRPEYASFPSGHATTVAATALAIGAMWPRTRWFMWLYALVIVFSRVAVLSHHPSDAIAGALVGAAGAALVRRWFAAGRLVFSPCTLSAFPGPSLRRIKAVMSQGIRGLR